MDDTPQDAIDRLEAYLANQLKEGIVPTQLEMDIDTVLNLIAQQKNELEWWSVGELPYE